MYSNRPERLDRDPHDRLPGTNVLLREEPYDEDDDEEEEDNGKGKEKDVEDDDEDVGYSVSPVSMSSFLWCEIQKVRNFEPCLVPPAGGKIRPHA